MAAHCLLVPCGLLCSPRCQKASPACHLSLQYFVDRLSCWTAANFDILRSTRRREGREQVKE